MDKTDTKSRSESAEVVRRGDVKSQQPETTDRSALPTGMLQPVDDPAEIVRAREERSRLITEALQEGRDYGSVKGIPKPFLHKPGAERLTDSFGCRPQFRILDQEVDHDRRVEWEKRSGKSGTSRGLYRYVVSCDLVHRASGIVVGNGLGACSTMEDKYVESPRNAENTCLKMAKKRAHVDAALSTFGLSEMFTQDADYVKGERSSGKTSGGEDAPAHTCPECEGKIWDNRPKIEAGEWKKNAPKFTCKDKDGCGWKSWDSEDEAFGGSEDEGYGYADPLQSFPELLNALAELEGLNEKRAANARLWLENRADEMRSSPQALSAGQERVEQAIAEERGETDESGDEDEVQNEDRNWVEATLDDYYGDVDTWDAKLRMLGTAHPHLTAEWPAWDAMAWNTARRFLETHEKEGIEHPHDYVPDAQGELA